MFIFFLIAQSLFGQSFVYPGIDGISSSGAGQVYTRGAEAAFYNPANIIFSKRFEIYGDVSFLKVNYTYKHINEKYDPVNINVTAPPVDLGFTFKPNSRVSFGLLLIPKGTGSAQKIEKVPQKNPVVNDGTYLLYNIESGSAGYQAGLGASVKITKQWFLGLSVNRISEKNTLIVTDAASDGSVPTIDASFGGDFNQFLIGTRLQFAKNKWTLAGTYKTSVTKTYQGTLGGAIAGKQAKDYSGVGYIPSAVSLGTEVIVQKVGIMGEYQFSQWSAANSVVKPFTPQATATTDYHDTHSFVGGIRYYLKKTVLAGSFGYYPANVGYGTESLPNVPAKPDTDVTGVGFAQFDNFSRFVFATGLRHSLSKAGFIFGAFNYQNASRSVNEGYSGEGDHSLTVYQLTFAGGYKF